MMKATLERLLGKAVGQDAHQKRLWKSAPVEIQRVELDKMENKEPTYMTKKFLLSGSLLSNRYWSGKGARVVTWLFHCRTLYRIS